MICNRQIEELDKKWRSEPESVLSEIQRLLKDPVPRRLLPPLLGIAGSALKAQFDHPGAERHIRMGLYFADQIGDELAAGRLHQRLSSVWHHMGNDQKALEENNLALLRSLLDIESVGKCLVDRGVFLYCLEEFRGSWIAYEASLLRLEDETYRFCALQGLVECSEHVGKATEAPRLVEEALKLEAFPEAKAKLVWSCGMLLARNSSTEQGIQRVKQAIEMLRDCSPVDTAIATVDLVKVLLLARRYAEARSEATQMLAYCGILRKISRVAEAAAVELANLAASGEGLTLAELETLRAKVSRAGAVLARQD